MKSPISPACSSAGGTDGAPGSDSPMPSADDGTAPVFGSDGGGIACGTSEGGSSTSNCASGAGSFVYVISDANDLYTFDPTQFPPPAAFTLVSAVPCDSSGVNSMAVDRSATAWVNFKALREV
jgi:hypothetical protein